MSKRAYPQNPAVPTRSNQPSAGFPGQPHRDVAGYPTQTTPYQNYTYSGQPVQNYSGHPVQQYPMPSTSRAAGQTFPGPTPEQHWKTGSSQPSAAGISSATAGVQQMQLRLQPGGSQLSTPPSIAGGPSHDQQPSQNLTSQGQYPQPPPTSTAPGATHASTSSAYVGPTQLQGLRQSGPPPHPGSMQAGLHPGSRQAGPPPPHPGNVLTGPPPHHPSSTQAGPPVSAGQPSTGQLPGQMPSGLLAGAATTPAPVSEQKMAPPTRQAFPPPPTSGQMLPPQPTHSGHTFPAPPTSGQMLPPTSGQMLPPPPASGQMPPVSGHMRPPPPTSGQMPPSSGQMLPPPPTSGQMLPPPPASGQMPPVSGHMRPPPPTSGQMPPSSGQMLPPPPTSGQMLPPPPASGQMPPVSGHMRPPPPTSGQMPPTSGQMLPPPPASGQMPPVSGHMRPPPPSSGQMPPSSGQMLPPPPTSGQMLPPTSGQMLPPPPVTGQMPSASGQMLPAPPMTGQMPSASGQMLPPPPASGQMLPPPPTSGQMLPPRPLAGPREFPTGLPPGHVDQPPGMRPSPGAGGIPVGMQTPATISDPMLQPVNLLEKRDLLPSSSLAPPDIVLPANLGQFNPSPSVFCSTMNTVPATSSLLNKLKLPFAVHIHPFKELPQNECPVIHPNIIVRCRVCRAYINPFVTFIDSRHWRCNLCYRPNTLPEDFDFNPQSGRRGDRTHRVELKRASVEYIAPSEYMVRPPQPSVYYFVIDVSFNTIETGLLGVFCRTLLDSLERLPGDARTMVGILTFDSTLHFYNLKSSLSQPQMLVVSDLEDVFLPSPEALLVNLRASRELVRTLLEDLPRMFANNRSVKSAMGAAVQAAEKLLHHIGGRVTVLQATLPNIGPGALKYRDVSLSSVKKGSLNMAPASDFYKKLALECSSQQIAVDLFAFSGQFVDLSTMSCISKFSSGQVFYYPDFHHTKEVPRTKFEKDLKRYLTRRIGFEAVMRIRCTEGLSLHTFHGNFFVRSTDLLSLPNVNPDHGYTMNIAIDESLKDVGMVCFQTALLYTSSRGERRIRVHTLALPVSSQLSHLYARLNVQAIAGVLANMAVDRSASATLGDAREALMNVVIDSTRMYRGHFASSLQASQFNLPTSLHLLPLFVTSLLKHPAFTLNSAVSYDARTQAMNLIKSLPVEYLIANVYPHLYALHMLTEKDVIEHEDGREVICPPIQQLSAEKLTRYGIFLMDYGLGLHIWVSKDAPHELIQKIFGVQHFGAIPEIMTSLPAQDNDMSTLVRRFVKQIRTSRQHFMPLQIIREDGPHRLLFIENLVEDRTDFGTSYYEFLTHINRQLSK